MDLTEYKKQFGLEPYDREKVEKALEHALDIRKFEISLYWQRATYFWALIAVAFAGYFAILGAEHLSDKEYLAYIVGCIGFVFTWAWFLVNRGSKYWQENWENHVDMLEDTITGPLYKTALHRPPETGLIEKYVIGPSTISVSKTNQWVSFFTLCIWLTLIFHALPTIDTSLPFSWRHILIALFATLFAGAMLHRGKAHQGPFNHIAKKRETRIA